MLGEKHRPDNAPTVYHNHPLLILTAFCHLSNMAAPLSSLILGLKMVLPSVLTLSKSWKFSHIPTANPAAMAAPSAVVSRIAGLFTGMPMMSACVCKSFEVSNKKPHNW